MTRSFNQFYECERCGNRSTQESAFARWVRQNPALDSGSGTVFSDFDYVVQRYVTPLYGRCFQCVMFFETKCNASITNPSQAQTLTIARQFMQNQRIADGQVRTIRDHTTRRLLLVRNYGGFELRLSKTDPSNSEWMEWNRKRITTDTLVKLLKFDIDPITFKAMDWRSNHHKPPQTDWLLPVQKTVCP